MVNGVFDVILVTVKVADVVEDAFTCEGKGDVADIEIKWAKAAVGKQIKLIKNKTVAKKILWAPITSSLKMHCSN
jgi:hypothetical protein